MEPITTASVTVGSVSTGITWASLANSLLQLFTGVAQHPLTSGIVGTLFGILWFFISGKFTAWRIKMAQNTTQQNETNFVQNQTPQNQQDNNQDNNGRKNLDGP
jgi:hypothetical protein